MKRTPEWARWQAQNPPPGWNGRSAERNRRFWQRTMVWEVRFWLTLAALMVVIGVAIIVWAVVHA